MKKTSEKISGWLKRTGRGQYSMAARVDPRTLPGSTRLQLARIRQSAGIGEVRG